MIIYHGSDIIIDKPDILHSGKRLDFGSGFYVTTVKSQAERWAKRKSVIRGKEKGLVSIFEYNENQDFNILDFGDNLDDWIDFVCECRNGSDIFRDYDVIKGKVADDKVFRVVDMYQMGIWDKNIHDKSEQTKSGRYCCKVIYCNYSGGVINGLDKCNSECCGLYRKKYNCRYYC